MSFPQRVFYSPGDETGGLNLEEQKEKGRSTISLTDYLVGVFCELVGSTCWIWG